MTAVQAGHARGKGTWNPGYYGKQGRKAGSGADPAVSGKPLLGKGLISLLKKKKCNLMLQLFYDNING